MSTPHCSLVVYLDANNPGLDAFQKDVSNFFQKFPLIYEVILVGPTAPKTLPETWRHITTKKGGRAQALWMALQEAQAPFVATANIEMNTPLGEIFKFLQNLMAEENIDIVWGNRYAKKESPFLLKATPRFRTEHFFNDILKEKRSLVTDPLSETFVIKKDALLALRGSLKILGSSWYLGPALLKGLQQTSARIMELPVFDAGYAAKGYSLWKQRWNLLRQSGH